MNKTNTQNDETQQQRKTTNNINKQIHEPKQRATNTQPKTHNKHTHTKKTTKHRKQTQKQNIS